MKIITFAIQKGGTGKTTTAAAITQAAAARGFRALAIDLDPQGHLSYSLGANMGRPGAFELLQGARAAPLIQETAQGLDIIPASRSLGTITSGPGSARRLSAALEPIRRSYDYIVIDGPAAGELQYNALQAATDLIIPTQANIFNIQSLYEITDTARRIQSLSNPGLKLAGIVITVYDGRSTLSRQMRDQLTERAGAMGLPVLGVIRAGIAVQEAATLQRSLFEYAPRSKPAADYMQLFDRISN